MKLPLIALSNNVLSGYRDTSIRTRIETIISYRRKCFQEIVIEILPLEQGLKPSFKSQRISADKIVIEILPLEQGLKHIKIPTPSEFWVESYRDTSIRTRIETIKKS